MLETEPTSFFDPFFYKFHLALVFWLGAVFGSFLNVCIYRIPKGLGLSMPPSHCYQCGHYLRWFHNIPLISYPLQGGKCRYCAASYSGRYFMVELMTALLFLGVFVRYCDPTSGYSLVIFPGFVFLSLLIVGTFTDIDHWIIPDRISLGGAVAGIVLAGIWPLGLAPHNPLAVSILPFDVPSRLLPVTNAIAGAALGYGGLWLVGALGTMIFRKDAMGQGDMKLFALLGAFLGPENCFYVLVIASLFGSVVGGAGLALGAMQRRKTPIPAVEPLEPDAVACEAYVERYDLTPTERLIVTRALTSPGSVGPIRHHLPFGPSLAAAAALIFVAWEPIHDWFFSMVMPPPM